ncbi:N-(5'-phosphoribosyl)anthranilate isomerase [Thalassobacillus devorans]|uniref:N-(5'-phosphoribosyl)anthranilate isomerase n=1 Tax=Thalassobacillus devorans TaxID=279813 RepID=A0ABQ1PRN2_9BACI|nr:phosphoribosylanthranilate isomerase [Thalassobacillus devorans]NIK30584.1 phosphoribosylanthranilate isomerase [Thalassobacillus devorans]GGD01746.1 N-(5'-phosphoribosyl)anthranilate isomerase [Thalassobacillus devorans]
MTEPLVKLCGNRSKQDLAYSADSQATHLGFIFVQGTKRYVRPELVGRWLYEIKPHQKLVGVFVEPTLEELEIVLHYVPLDIIQLHGNETVSEVLQIKEHFAVPVYKVIHHADFGVDYMHLFKGAVDGFVVDSKVKGAYGGTGVRFDWKAIPSYMKEAEHQGVPCLIAGGITDENAAEVLNYHPGGIDLSSGTETDNKKDRNKIQALMREVENYGTSISGSTRAVR